VVSTYCLCLLMVMQETQLMLYNDNIVCQYCPKFTNEKYIIKCGYPRGILYDMTFH